MGDGSSLTLFVEHLRRRPPGTRFDTCMASQWNLATGPASELPGTPSDRCVLNPRPVAVTAVCEANHAMCMAD